MIKHQRTRSRLLSSMAFVILMSLVCTLTSCAGSVTTTVMSSTTRKPGSLDFPLLDESFLSTFSDKLSADTRYAVKTNQDAYPVGVEKISWTIENHSDQDMMTGAFYALEVFHDNAWYSVPFKKLEGNVQRVWPAIAYLVPAKGQWTGDIVLAEHVALSPGRYRVIKELMSQERENRQSLFIRAEFEIEPAATKTNVVTRSEGSYVNRTFTQSIESSDVTVVARLVSRDTDKDGTIRNRMAVSEVLDGNITNPVIAVHQTAHGYYRFLENTDYVLILYLADIVTNPGPRYYLVDDCEFRLDQKKEKFTVKSRAQNNITEPYVESFQAFKKWLLEVKQTQKAPASQMAPEGERPGNSSTMSSPSYVISDDLNFIYQHSEVVARVRLDQEIVSGTYAVIMGCQVLEVYKGHLPQYVRIHLFLGPKVGDEYLVMINANSPDLPQTSWSLSSKKSQIPIQAPEYARFRGTYFE